MKTDRPYLFLALLSMAAATPGASGQAARPAPVQLEARFVKFTSFCDFDDPGGAPAKETIKAGTTFESSGCGDLDKLQPRPQAVVVTVRNPSAEPVPAAIDGLDAVALVKKSGARVKPAVMGRKQSGPAGAMYLLMTGFKGSWVPVVPAGGSIQIAFFFVGAAAGDSVTISKLGTAKIP
jgi:hypothetical protein